MFEQFELLSILKIWNHVVFEFETLKMFILTLDISNFLIKAFVEHFEMSQFEIFKLQFFVKRPHIT